MITIGLIISFIIIYFIVPNPTVWGFVPSLFWSNISGEWIKLITHIFMHANLIHLAFNSFALYQFGRTVELYLGPIKYVIFFILAGVVQSLLYAMLQSKSTIPTIGASGAIAAVMSVYLLRGGNNNGLAKVVSNEFYNLLFKRYTNVNYLGHILGFGVGWLFYILLRY